MRVELLSISPDSEKLIEQAGRTSYLSFGKEGKDTEKKFIRMLMQKEHYSVLEHAYATLRISGVSRAFTHQLVRHRLCSFTQQSQRHVNESNFAYIEPNSIKNDAKAHDLFTGFMEQARNTYRQMLQRGIKYEDARFVLPNAVESQIVVTANLREWRHIIELRSGPNAQWEIRSVATEILRILKSHAPAVFEDFEIDRKGIISRKDKMREQ